MADAETVTIPRAEFERLVAAAEDAADREAVREHRAAKAAGRVLTISDAQLERILDGESPLRIFREERGMTQAQLSAAAAVNRVQIANIEAGTRRGSVGTLKRLADALGVLVDDLI